MSVSQNELCHSDLAWTLKGVNTELGKYSKYRESIGPILPLYVRKYVATPVTLQK